MFISDSVCGCAKDIWHHQPAHLCPVPFSKDEERESKKEMHLKQSNTQMIPSDSSTTQRTWELSEQRGLCVCVYVASLNSFILNRRKAHSKKCYHPHTSVKMKKHSQAFSLLYFHVIPKVSFHMTLIVVIHLLTVFSKCRKKSVAML